MTDKLKIVALLPMKAHSSRVPGKNFLELSGKPLFKWMLDTLLSVPEIERIIINTDARAILNDKGLTESERILIRDRKTKLCGDEVSMNRIIADDVNAVPADIYLMTHTTNPLLSANTIEDALDRFKRHHATGETDSLFTVNKVQTRFYRKDGRPVNHDPDNLIPTQDLEPWYEENSNLYIFTRESFLQTNARIGLKPMMHETPNMESIDIDVQEDWDLAEALSGIISKQK